MLIFKRGGNEKKKPFSLDVRNYSTSSYVLIPEVLETMTITMLNS